MSRATIQCPIYKVRQVVYSKTICFGLVVVGFNGTQLILLNLTLKCTCNSRMIKHSDSFNGMQVGPDFLDICICTLCYCMVFQRRVCTIKIKQYEGFSLLQFHSQAKKMTFTT